MPRAVHHAIAAELRERIADGSLPPGSVLPSEAELAATWGTSRGPVRNALAALRQEGLVDARQGRPARVLAPQDVQTADTYVAFSAWATGLGRRPGATTVELALARAGADEAAALDLVAGAPVVRMLRVRLLDGDPAMVERTSFTEEVGRLLFAHGTDDTSITALLADHGTTFDRVTHELDAVAADDRDAVLLDVAPSAPLLRVRRRSCTADGRPFECSDDRYRADRVRFSVEAGARIVGDRPA